jgi:hypothetical protein
MAFLRHEKGQSGNYLSICESYRDDTGLSKQKIVIVPTEHQEVLMDVDTPEDYDWIQKRLHNSNSFEKKKRSLS